MNYLKVDNNGGMFLDADDLIFNQKGIVEAIAGVASLLGGRARISGASLTGVDSISEGFVFF